MKVIVAGDRDFIDYNFVRDKLDYYLQNVEDEIEIVSGCCRGVDKLGELYSEQSDYILTRFPADLDLYGKGAGPRRNEQMARYATHCIAFLKEGSKGTADMIKRAKHHQLVLRVINI